MAESNVPENENKEDVSPSVPQTADIPISSVATTVEQTVEARISTSVFTVRMKASKKPLLKRNIIWNCFTKTDPKVEILLKK